MKKAMINYMQNEKNDELYTPDYAITPLLKYLDSYSALIGYKPVIWECTDYGNSNITKILKLGGYKVMSTTKNKLNFLQDKADFDFDIIVTNPPYSLKDEFIQKCYEYGKPFCLLLPITALEGIKRGNMFRKYGIDVLIFDKRVEFMEDDKKTNNWFNTSWFCWNILPKQLIFEELKKEI